MTIIHIFVCCLLFLPFVGHVQAFWLIINLKKELKWISIFIGILKISHIKWSCLDYFYLVKWLVDKNLGEKNITKLWTAKNWFFNVRRSHRFWDTEALEKSMWKTWALSFVSVISEASVRLGLMEWVILHVFVTLFLEKLSLNSWNINN